MTMEIREIMQALDSDPSLLEELRARILTRELLEMPENLATLTHTSRWKPHIRATPGILHGQFAMYGS